MDLGESSALGAVAYSPFTANSFLSDGLHAADHLPPVRIGYLAREHLEVPLRIHCRLASFAAMSGVWLDAAHRALLCVRCDGAIAGSMRLMDRDLDILTLLRSGRWLTTRQIHRRHFVPSTLSAGRRRLRTLRRAKLVRKEQPNRMEEALFTLGPEGKRLLEREPAVRVALERSLPKQLAHLKGINDARIAAELTPDLRYFFAAWELPASGWKHCIIPDAIFRIGDRAFALEYDRGFENVRYFVDSKIATYRRGRLGIDLAAVLIVVDTESRRRTLTQVTEGDDHVRIVLLDTIRKEDLIRCLEIPVLTGCSIERTSSLAKNVVISAS